MNKFEMNGRISFIEFKNNGATITTASIGQKKKDGTYNNYRITLFGDIAECFAVEVMDGDYVNLKGYLTINSYKPKGCDREIKQINLIVTEFTKQKWENNKLVDVVKDNAPEVSEEEIPF